MELGSLGGILRGLAGAVLACHAAVAAEVVLESCNQYVEGGAVVLAGDLDCSAAPDDQALRLRGGVFDLRGFTLIAPAGTHRAIYCDGNCRVRGPGTVVGSLGTDSDSHDGVHASDLTVEAPGDPGGTQFAFGGARAKLERVVISGFRTGVSVYGRAKIYDSILTGTGHDIGYGVGADRATLVRSTITEFSVGVFGFRTRLIDASVVGNGLVPCPTSCADVMSVRRPSLRGTSTCGTSMDPVTEFPWGVCIDD